MAANPGQVHGGDTQSQPSTAPGYHLQAVETVIYEMQECPVSGVY